MIVNDAEHIEDFLIGVQTFISETSYPIQYNEGNAYKHTLYLLCDPSTSIILNYQDEVFAGFAIVGLDYEFQDKPFGYVSKFYVMPDARGTTAGRELVEEMVDWFDMNQCVCSFATSTANIGQDKLYINLMAKFGFQLSGTVLMRKPNE